MINSLPASVHKGREGEEEREKLSDNHTMPKKQNRKEPTPLIFGARKVLLLFGFY